MVMVVLTALAGNGISYTVGAGVTVYATGSLFVALIYTFMMVRCLYIGHMQLHII
jgi:4-hydroxybenzoate polyprenyltransferase